MSPVDTPPAWFLGIGAQRSGTTMLYEELSGHEEVYLPRERKEVHYFDQYFDRGEDWYRGFFPMTSEQVSFQAIGEITPRYMVDAETAERIHAWKPDCRLIAILRNPADRAFSQYTFRIRDYNERRSFNQFLEEEPDAMKRGFYARQLSRYLKLFPREQLLVLIMEEAIVDREAMRLQLAEFLGLDASRFRREVPGKRVNESYRVKHAGAYAVARRFGVWLRSKNMDGVVNRVRTSGVKKLFGRSGSLPKLDPAVRSHLLAAFEEDIRKLEGLIGRDLQIWRNPR